MAQTLALGGAPTAAALNSVDIVVQAQPISVFAYTADGTFPSGSPQMFIDRKIGAVWQQEHAFGGSSGRVVTLYGPGTYRARKGATTDLIGFGKDDGT